MFNNIGGKMKALAKMICTIGIIASVIGGIALIGSGVHAIFGILAMILGAFFAWIGTWVLYGFGELIEQTTTIARNTPLLGLITADEVKKTGHN